MAVKASVVIPHYNDLANLEVCLDLLNQQTVPRDQFQIVVADNNSACGLAAVETAVGARATVVAAPEKGAGPARNAGVAAATGPILAFIDSDCRPKNDWLERGIAALAGDNIVGGLVHVDVRDPSHLTAVEAFEAAFAFRFEKYIARDKFTGAGNMFVAKSVFDRVGGFRAGLSEDKEWCHRALAMGHKLIYAGDAEVGHPARRTFRELVAKWRRVTSESYRYALERRGSRLIWFVRSWVVLVSCIPHTVSLLTSPKVAKLSDRIRAIPILYGIRAYRFVEMNRLLVRSLRRRAEQTSGSR